MINAAHIHDIVTINGRSMEALELPFEIHGVHFQSFKCPSSGDEQNVQVIPEFKPAVKRP